MTLVHSAADMKPAVVLSVLVLALGCSDALSKDSQQFPDDFIFGVGTASYQVEGAWNADGKGENIWDYMTHHSPHVIKDRSNGDIAADSYHNYHRDVEMLRELGVDAYRFSLSWSRILPQGTPNLVNQAGLDYYNNFIDEMLKYNIQPMVTLYHWDLPQKLQELGGFVNPLMVDWFADYAKVVFENFGDRVKFWITFNEPTEICDGGYGSSTKAPIVNSTAEGTYLCAKNLVIAHAKAYHLYVDEFKSSQGGECGITIDVNWFDGLTDSEEDQDAAEIMRQCMFSLYSEPIFSSEGGFPKEFAKIVAEKSAAQGYPRSRLPEFTDEEREFVRGAADFFGVNHYTGFKITPHDYGHVDVPSMDTDAGVACSIPKDWKRSASAWLCLAPNSLYEVLSYLHQRYNSPKFYITENGWSTRPDHGLDDNDRVIYYHAALDSVVKTLEAGINLKGYMAWSLMDNFEWMQGYTERFGLYQVDFEDPTRTRTPRKSAFVYKHIIKHRVVDYEYEPESSVMTIDEGH